MKKIRVASSRINRDCAMWALSKKTVHVGI